MQELRLILCPGEKLVLKIRGSCVKDLLELGELATQGTQCPGGNFEVHHALRAYSYVLKGE